MPSTDPAYLAIQAIFNPTGQPFGDTDPNDDDAPVAA